MALRMMYLFWGSSMPASCSISIPEIQSTEPRAADLMTGEEIILISDPCEDIDCGDTYQCVVDFKNQAAICLPDDGFEAQFKAVNRHEVNGSYEGSYQYHERCFK